jgi:predicted transcriptional regulator
VKMSVIVMSIKPKWVEMILRVNKSVELRRRGPSKKFIGTHAYIYATSPKSCIVARCVIADITIDTPERLWQQVGTVSGCTQSEFSDYFKNAAMGTALHLASVEELDEIPLNVLKGQFSWHPPMSWCQVRDDSELISRLRS